MRALLGAFALLVSIPAAAESTGAAPLDRALVKAFLGSAHEGMSFDAGPIRLDSSALRRMYPGRRFYAVHSARPLPPAKTDAVTTAEWRTSLQTFGTKLNTIVAIDADDTASELTDFNAGLVRIASDADARTAAEAIVSLVALDYAPPSAAGVQQVRIHRENGGWRVTLRQNGRFDGEVVFDAKGHVKSVENNFLPPLAL